MLTPKTEEAPLSSRWDSMTFAKLDRFFEKTPDSSRTTTTTTARRPACKHDSTDAVLAPPPSRVPVPTCAASQRLRHKLHVALRLRIETSRRQSSSLTRTPHRRIPVPACLGARASVSSAVRHRDGQADYRMRDSSRLRRPSCRRSRLRLKRPRDCYRALLWSLCASRHDRNRSSVALSSVVPDRWSQDVDLQVSRGTLWTPKRKIHRDSHHSFGGTKRTLASGYEADRHAGRWIKSSGLLAGSACFER